MNQREEMERDLHHAGLSNYRSLAKFLTDRGWTKSPDPVSRAQKLDGTPVEVRFKGDSHTNQPTLTIEEYRDLTQKVASEMVGQPVTVHTYQEWMQRHG